jgi:hypothetical protein
MKNVTSVLLFLLYSLTARAQESPERINEIFKAYSAVYGQQDSILVYNDLLAEKVNTALFRERLLISSGKSGLASVLISLGTSIGSLTLAVQGETNASYAVSLVGQALSTVLLCRAFILLSKAGEELANERLLKEGILD